ncbi:MAG: hypothetical protein ACR2QL_09020 [Woeseiaceae bacterium]
MRNAGLRRFATSLLVATLAVRALLPVGYMPGNLAAGEFAELCPVGSAATFQLLGSAATHGHHHDDNESDAVSIGTACPIGSSLFFDALPTLSAAAEQQNLQPIFENVARGLSVLTAPRSSHRARAPPLS